MQGPKHLGHVQLLCQVHQHRTGLGAEQLGFELALTWEANVRGGGFSRCATVLAPHQLFLVSYFRITVSEGFFSDGADLPCLFTIGRDCRDSAWTVTLLQWWVCPWIHQFLHTFNVNLKVL